MQEPGSPSLFLDRSPASTAAVLLAAVANKNVDRHFVQEGDAAAQGITQPLPVLRVNAKETYSGYAAIAKYLAKDSQLLGKSETDKAEVEKWLSWPSEVGNVDGGFDKQKHMKELSKVSKLLLTKVYLVSNSLSAADLVVFATLLPLMPGIDVHTRSTTLAAVTRFFDLIQHHPQVFGVLSINASIVEVDLNYPFNPKPPQEKKAGDKAAAGPSTSGSEKAKPQPQKRESSAPKPSEGGDQKPATGQGDKGKAAEGQAKPKPQPGGRQPKQPKPAPGADVPDIARLDIRVGQITKVAKHPDAATLYVEEINLGEDAPRQVVSGLVAHVPEDQMLNARVICLCNLKPAKMRGVMSHAMVLCASTADKSKVELLRVPEGASIGERVIFETFEGHQPDAQLNPKKKVWETVQPNFFTRDDLVACYRDASGTPRPFNTSAGPCKAASVVGGNIS